MKIGVVCEGPTDFLAISAFLGESLKNRGIDAEFVDIQPTLDATSTPAGGGWSNAVIWLQNNPPETRRIAYLGSGLFAGALSAKRCDMLIIQIDTDVLAEESFQNFVKKHLAYEPIVYATPVEKYDEIQDILVKFCGYADLQAAIDSQHLVSPAVENTETWCVAARSPDIVDVEGLTKANITAEFETRLTAHEAGGAQQGSLKNIDRRRGYCLGHFAEYSRVELGCPHYLKLVEMVVHAAA